MRRVFLLLGLVALVHAGALTGPLLYDDAHAVAENPAIRDLANLGGFFTDPGLFSANTGRMYRPLVLTTLALDHALGGGAAWAFRLGNLLQHLLVCFLALRFLPLFFRRAGLDRRAAETAAVLGTLLFALHPLTSESLCLVSSRSILLASAGFLTALDAWYRHAGRPYRRAFWVGLGTLGACLSRETGVLVVPLLWLAEHLVPARDGGKPRAGQPVFRLPRSMTAWSSLLSGLGGRFLIPVAPALVLTVFYLHLRKALFGLTTVPFHLLRRGWDPHSGGSRGLGAQFSEMAMALPRALWLWVWPRDLNVDHPTFYAFSPISAPVLCGAGAILGLVFLAFLRRRRSPLFAFATLGSLLVAAPWILVPLNVPFAEHRLYLCLLLFGLPLAALSGKVLVGGPPALRRTLAAGLAVVLAVLAVRAAVRERDWRSSKALWSSAVAGNPRSFRGWSGLGEVAILEGETGKAIRFCERGRAIYDRYQPLRRNLLEARLRHLEKRRDEHEARRTFALVRRQVEERWKDPFARLLMARACRGLYLVTGDPSWARRGSAWALSCLAMVPAKRLVYRTALVVLKTAGLHEEALTLCGASRERIEPDRGLRLLRADLLMDAGRLEEARSLLRELRGAGPPDPGWIRRALRLHALMGEGASWRRLAETARRLGIDPGPFSPGRARPSPRAPR